MTRLNIIDGGADARLAYRNATRRKFRVIDGMGVASLSTSTPQFDQNPEDAVQALAVLEAQMDGEFWYLNEVRALIRRKTGIIDPKQPLDTNAYPHLTSKSGHDNLIHIAQFFFLLDALKIKTPEQIDAFIRSHNEKIDELIQNRTTNITVTELRKVIFKSARKAQVKDTFDYYRKPIFAISEIGYFLFYVMSPATATNVINDLLHAGMLMRLNPDGVPGATDPRRILVEPIPEFKNLYLQSLLRTRSRIL